MRAGASGARGGSAEVGAERDIHVHLAGLAPRVEGTITNRAVVEVDVRLGPGEGHQSEEDEKQTHPCAGKL